jgi:myo-inositol-1(or 4)-monophosphatase
VPSLPDRFDAACRLAAEAGRIALRMRPPPGAAAGTLKGHQDWLSAADGAVETFLSDSLAALFPEDGFQGEEGGTARGGAWRWVVDPIDGTANYVRGRPRFCVSLGLLSATEALIGVIVAPALGETYAAMQGAGATLNGAPIRAAATDALDRALIEVGYSSRLPFAEPMALAARLDAAGASVRMGGSGALGLADVACGRSDGYVERHINPWDVAASLAILREAGAAISPFLSGNGAKGGNPILAAAPGVAAPLAEISGIGLA